METIEIKVGSELLEVDLARMNELDCQAYGADIFIADGRAEARFRADHSCFTAAYAGDRMVGVWGVHPVTAEFAETVYQSPVVLDDEMEAQHILPLSPTEINHLFAIDLVVDPSYRGCGLSHRMLESFRGLLWDLQGQGYRFGKIFGFTVTTAGTHMMLKYGAVLLRLIGDGGLFEINSEQFIRPVGSVPLRKERHPI